MVTLIGMGSTCMGLIAVLIACSVGCGGQPTGFEDHGPVPYPTVGDGSARVYADPHFEAGAPDCGHSDAAPPEGCTPNEGVCAQLGVTCCAGWDCDAGPSNKDCVLEYGNTYACGPATSSGILGDPVDNGCVRFRSNLCSSGIEAVAYACPDTTGRGGPNQGSCDVLMTLTNAGGVPNGLAWCCQ